MFEEDVVDLVLKWKTRVKFMISKNKFGYKFENIIVMAGNINTYCTTAK